MIAVHALVRVFADDVVCRCDRCGADVFARPHTLLLSVTERICVGCYAAVRSPDDTHLITDTTLQELRLWNLTHGKREH